MSEATDQIGARWWHRFGPRRPAPSFDGDPRLALITVNYSTTRFLKLMLCSLSEQSELWFLQQILIVDNGSRDGGIPFLRALAARSSRVHLLERRHFLNHAAGMRAGMRALDGVERALPPDERATVLVFCDPDLVFRKETTLRDLAAAITRKDAAFVGEARGGPGHGHPDVQASFFAVRRDVLGRRDVRPLANHGSPAYDLQSSVLRAGLKIVDFPSNHAGYVLHRGRSAVVAATTYRVGAYAGVANREPHYMGVPDGARIWADIEHRWAPWLEEGSEAALLDHLVSAFSVLGSATEP